MNWKTKKMIDRLPGFHASLERYSFVAADK